MFGRKKATISKLIVGLGNPGDKYELTRHNVGWRVLDELASAEGLSFSYVKECNTELVKNGGVIYCKPQTFMNDSGRGVRAVMDYYKVDPANVIVVYDDKDIAFGTVRLRSEGSAAGHNGVKSVIQHIGTDFARVRVGVAGKEMDQFKDAAAYVLGRFSTEEEVAVPKIVEAGADAVRELVADGIDKTNHRDITVDQPEDSSE